MKYYLALLCGVLGVTYATTLSFVGSPASMPSISIPIDYAPVSRIEGKAVAFVSNFGQLPWDIYFHSVGTAGSILFRSSTITFEQEGADGLSGSVTLRLVGSSTRPRIEGVEPIESIGNNIHRTDGSKWHIAVPTFAGVRYRDLYPGIDLTFKRNADGIGTEFVVAPDTDVDEIIMRFEDALNVEVDLEGFLVVKTAAGNLTIAVPHGFQMIEGMKNAVEVRYDVDRYGSVHFDVGDYDTMQQLIIAG